MFWHVTYNTAVALVMRARFSYGGGVSDNSGHVIYVLIACNSFTETEYSSTETDTRICEACTQSL